jgi:5-methylcytosine-specific restriction endonuclease McrA
VRGHPAGLRGFLVCLGLLALLPAAMLLLDHPRPALAAGLGLLLLDRPRVRRAPGPAPAAAIQQERRVRRPRRPVARPPGPGQPVPRPTRARGPIPARLRFRVLERDGFRCRYCGRSGRDEGVVLHADHIVPVVAGGETTERNLITACEACNLGKGAGLVRPLGAT